MTQLSAKALLNTATDRTGLSDFGHYDILEGYEKLIAGINRANSVNPERLNALNECILLNLTNALRFCEDAKNHPEILEQELLPPLVIASLPRTGTTKLQRLLSSTNAFRDLPFWQIHTSSRIPDEPDSGRATRIADAKQYCEWLGQASPKLHLAHTIQAEEPEEEALLLDGAFRNNRGLHDSPDFEEWLSSADISPGYDYLLHQLKYLQWQFYRENPKPLIIKSPSHLGHEEQIDRIFPKGRKYVFTHRKPTEIVASACFLAEAVRQLYYNVELQRELIGVLVLTMFSHNVTANMAWRDRSGADEVLDISFDRVNHDGIAVAREVYEFAGVSVSDDFIAQLEQWEQENPRHKRGKPDYSLKTYGLTEQQVNEAFAPYIDRFAKYL